MQVADIIATVRDILQDQDVERYDDPSLLRALTMSITDLRRIRPDYFIGRFQQPIQPVRALSETIDLPMQVYSPLIEYTAGMAEMRDDEFTTDGRAQSMLNNFRVALGGQ